MTSLARLKRSIWLRMARSRAYSRTIASASAVLRRSRASPLHAANPDLDIRHPECGAALPAGGLEAHAGCLPVVRDERRVLAEPIGSELLEGRGHRRVHLGTPLAELRQIGDFAHQRALDSAFAPRGGRDEAEELRVLDEARAGAAS